ncbi:sorbitol ABC transporter ATP-binding protein /mannitol ABC transporter ATP-binding protein [Aliiruegeria haliotis]|uniref:Sorbitol ABC transporter ATP-binding protein /mannitol ABC transporter ATP-binding protein n=1 Tax=Aliiruegeria haliotis TaxID=1280846 RepID=A0A2T0RMA6_9RHOB|nr:sn-glycerol-3-phosphate ABC transporter ATP-binding protein UgpC [Aliiruegeria haliotis]PRY22267.1 sorbitol ABC transporter ATP-binding protein /mannitol ABC transporter ATP-binding protein [Aliiruegeria haliotis]
MTELSIQGLYKRYGAVEVLTDINLNVRSGEFTVFVGPSGCGKSTLLRMVCGLDEVSAGTLAIDGEIVNDVPPSKRGIAMVFQTYALYPHMTVAENMGYALKLAGEDKGLIAERVRRAAEILKIESYLDRKPRQLSGGQRQRVAIGRAIVREPKIFLFDEPLSNLDAALRVDMRMEFARLKERLGTTMIYVTHDQVEAMTLADKIVVMSEGRIEQVGSPLDLYRAPENRFVAGFIGSPKMNFMPVTGQGDGRLQVPGGTIDIPAEIDASRVVEVGIRPEHMQIGLADENTLRGNVMTAEHLGSDTFAYVEIEGLERPVMVRLDGEHTIQTGDPVDVGFATRSVHLFDSDGLALRRQKVSNAA